MGVPQGQLLAAVHPVLGVIDVEQNAPRHLVEAVAEQIDHRRHHALERGRAGQVFQPADGRLRAQIGTAFGQPPDRHLERRVTAQRVAVIAVGIARRDQQGAVADHLGKPVPHPVRVARVFEAGGQPFGDLEPLLDGRQQQDPGIRGQPAAVESDMHRLARHRWQTRQNPRSFPSWRARTPLSSDDPASATKSYTKPTAYTAPASPFTRPGELFGLNGPKSVPDVAGALITSPSRVPCSCTPSSCVIETMPPGTVAGKPGALFIRK